VRHAVDRHLTFLHCLKQCALSLGWCTVDLIRQQEGSEYRSFDQMERRFLEIEDIRSRDIGRHQVGGELNAREIGSQHFRQRTNQQRLRDAWHTLQQNMVSGENRDQALIHHGLLADNDLGHFRAGFTECLFCGFHRSRWWCGQSGLGRVSWVHGKGRSQRRLHNPENNLFGKPVLLWEVQFSDRTGLDRRGNRV